MVNTADWAVGQNNQDYFVQKGLIFAVQISSLADFLC